MAPGPRAALIALVVMAIGLAAVYLEVEQVRAGARIRQLFLQKDAALESVRRLELRYNRMLSPDLLEHDLRDWDGAATATAPPAQ
jgi:hypothetical protein